MEFLDSPTKIRKAVMEVVKGAKDLRCAVAFWGHGADKLLKPVGQGSQVRILCNLLSGGTNPEVIKTLGKTGKKFGWEIRHRTDLHAKVFCGDDLAVIGSANASANGLGAEGDEANCLVEACVLVDDDLLIRQIQEWFDLTWSHAKQVTHKDLELASDRWARQRARRPPILEAAGTSLLTALEEDPRAFDSKDLLFIAWHEHLSREDEVQLKTLREKEQDRALDFFAEMELPKGATIISVQVNRNGIPRPNASIWCGEVLYRDRHLDVCRALKPRQYKEHHLTASDEAELRLMVRSDAFKAVWAGEDGPDEGAICLGFASFFSRMK